MTQQFTDIMVDIETTGLQPDRNAVLQIGAVLFNHKTREVSPNFFCESLSMPPFRHWDEGTRSWWAQQDPKVYQNIVQNQRPYKEVMQDFQKFVVDAAFGGKQLVFWSKPTHFDFMFIASYFADCGLANPLNYRTAQDMNTFIRGCYYPEEVCQETEKSVVHEAAAHDGLQDCFYQLKVLFAHLDKLGK